MKLTKRIDPLGARALYGMHSYPKLRPLSVGKINEWKSNQKALAEVANS